MTTFYWYPKCTTCKKAKSWLDENKIEYTIIDMIQSPPSKEKLEEWMTASSLPIRRFFNTSGIKYREMGLKDKVSDFSITDAANLLSTDGMLIKRPILIADNSILLGFKEEEYANTLNAR